MREKLRGEVRGISACLNILLSSEQLRAGESSLCYVIASPKWEVLVCPCVPWQPCLISMLCLLPQIKLSRDRIRKPHWLAPCRCMWSQTGVQVGMNRQCSYKVRTGIALGMGDWAITAGNVFLQFLPVSAFHLCMWMLKLLRVGIRSEFFHSWGNEVWFFFAFQMDQSHSASSWRSEH